MHRPVAGDQHAPANSGEQAPGLANAAPAAVRRARTLSAILPVRVDVACNDPDSGIFAGRVPQIQIADVGTGDILLELDAHSWDPLSSRITGVRYREAPGEFVLAGKRWPVLRRKEWYGNWCWNACWMADQQARAFLVWLRQRNLFSVSGGVCELCDAWDAGDPALATLLASQPLVHVGLPAVAA
jgi:hypothetical protein